MQFVLRLGQFLEKATLHEADRRPFLVGEHRENKMKGTFRPGGRNVKQSPFFFQVAFPVNGAFVREEAVGQPDDEDMRKLQPLGLMNGGQAKASFALAHNAITRFGAQENELGKHFVKVLVLAGEIHQALQVFFPPWPIFIGGSQVLLIPTVNRLVDNLGRGGVSGKAINGLKGFNQAVQSLASAGLS